MLSSCVCGRGGSEEMDMIIFHTIMTLYSVRGCVLTREMEMGDQRGSQDDFTFHSGIVLLAVNAQFSNFITHTCQ